MARPTKVTDWFYDVKDLEVLDREPSAEEGEEAPEPKKRVVTKKVKVEVWMDKKTSETGGPPYALTEVSFTIKCDDPKFSFSGTDIECLRETAWGTLDDKFKIKWENFYLVKVRPERIYDGQGSGLSFSYDWVYKGTTWDGKELLRQSQFRGEDKITPWPGRFTDKNGQTLACIPATDENREALEEFGRRVDKLRDLMRDTLKPENIIKTLQNLSGLALLPPATDDETTTDQETEGS
jgi:hypothetical protein